MKCRLALGLLLLLGLMLGISASAPDAFASGDCAPSCLYEGSDYEFATSDVLLNTDVPTIVSEADAAALETWFTASVDAGVAGGVTEVGLEAGILAAGTVSVAVPIVGIAVVAYLVFEGVSTSRVSPPDGSDCNGGFGMFSGARWFHQGGNYILEDDASCSSATHAGGDLTFYTGAALHFTGITNQTELDDCNALGGSYAGYFASGADSAIYSEFQDFNAFRATYPSAGVVGNWVDHSGAGSSWPGPVFDSSCGAYVRLATPTELGVGLLDGASTVVISTSPSGTDLTYATPNSTPDYVQTREDLNNGDLTFRNKVNDQLGTYDITMPDCVDATATECLASFRELGWKGRATFVYGDPAPAPRQDGKVQSTRPQAGQKVQVQTTVKIKLWAPYDGSPPPSPPPDNCGDTVCPGGLPGGNTTCTCPPIDFSPITSIDYGTKFPFGAFSSIYDLSGNLVGGDTTPISFHVPYDGHNKTLTLGTSSWEDTYRLIVFAIIDFLAGVLVLLIAFRLIGKADVE